mgnify:CR=1 FL=1
MFTSLFLTIGLIHLIALASPGPDFALILRTSLHGDRWADNIPWDGMQRLKAEAGFGEAWGVEVFPADREVVNVANIRHLWLLDAQPAFAWSKSNRG